ncbi:MAG: hypothetical protein ACM3VV_02220 [Deltaproteobacteria bacterium]
MVFVLNGQKMSTLQQIFLMRKEEKEQYKQRVKVLEEENIRLQNENERLNKENNDLTSRLKVIKKITEG